MHVIQRFFFLHYVFLLLMVVCLASCELDFRSDWQKPGVVIKKFGDLREKAIMDIGVGKDAYFTRELKKTAGKVYAVDVDPEVIRVLSQEQDFTNVEVFEVQPEDPFSWKTGDDIQIDGVLMVNTLRYIETDDDKIAYFAKIHQGLRKAEGIFVLVDFKDNSDMVGQEISDISELDPAMLKKMLLKDVGFQRVVIDLKSLEYQFIITAYKE